MRTQPQPRRSLKRRQPIECWQGHRHHCSENGAAGQDPVGPIIKSPAVVDHLGRGNDPYKDQDDLVSFNDTCHSTHYAVAAENPLAPRPLSTSELGHATGGRHVFSSVPRRPVMVVLDRVRQNYNIGAMFRLCDAFLIGRLVVCGADLNLRKRRLVQAAAGTQRWVPSQQAPSALPIVTAAKAAGTWVIVAQQTAGSVPPDRVVPSFPACLVLGSERDGVGQELVDLADSVIAIPMLGMANSLNVSTAAAILLYWLSVSQGDGRIGSHKR